MAKCPWSVLCAQWQRSHLIVTFPGPRGIRSLSLAQIGREGAFAREPTPDKKDVRFLGNWWDPVPLVYLRGPAGSPPTVVWARFRQTGAPGRVIFCCYTYGLT